MAKGTRYRSGQMRRATLACSALASAAFAWIAWAQERPPFPPRPVRPPETLRNPGTYSPPANPPAVSETGTMSGEEASEPPYGIRPAQFEKKGEALPRPAPVTPPPLLNVPSAPLPPLIEPPVTLPPRIESPAPPAPPPAPAFPSPPIATPVVEPKLPPGPTIVTPPVTPPPAPVQPWSPKDTPAKDPLPKVDVTPELTSPPPSRFVVPPRSPQTPYVETSLPKAPEKVEPPPEPPGPRRFTMHKVWRQSPDARPSTEPKTLVSRPVEPGPLGPSVAGSSPVSSGLASHTPQIAVEKQGPYFHKAGGSIKYQILLRNVGPHPAIQVRVEDEIPGMKLRGATPPTSQSVGDRLVWVLPSLRPGEEKIIQMDVTPTRPGDLVSTTSVHVSATTSFRTTVDGDVSVAPDLGPGPAGPSLAPSFPAPSSTIPKAAAPAPALAPDALKMEVKSPASVAVGAKATFEIVVANKGAVPLTGLMLYGTIPAGLHHPEGKEIGADLPDIAPGDVKTFKMPVTAMQAGKYVVEIRVAVGKQAEVVAQPQLTVDGPTAGPTLLPTGDAAAGTLVVQVAAREETLTVGKETIYAIRVTNPGPGVATGVTATVTLSDGLEAGNFAQASAAYTVRGKQVFFAPIPRLAPGASASFHIGVRATGMGEQRVRVQATSEQQRTASVREERTMAVRDR